MKCKSQTLAADKKDQGKISEGPHAKDQGERVKCESQTRGGVDKKDQGKISEGLHAKDQGERMECKGQTHGGPDKRDWGGK